MDKQKIDNNNTHIMSNNNTVHHCDVCKKAMTISDMGYMGKPLISKKNLKYRGGRRGVQILCHLHYDEVLIKQGKHPNSF
tara:strand:+ start:902 stop:1141 length:240 start_codon:yes stop_codon:yes gene_type:complete